MVVDDDVGVDLLGQRVVARAGLRIDERKEGRVLGHGAEVDALDGDELDAELTHHGAVLRAPDDAAERHHHLQALALEDALQAQRRRDRIGIGVVVREHHDRRAASAELLPLARLIAYGLERGRQVESHGPPIVPEEALKRTSPRARLRA